MLLAVVGVLMVPTVWASYRGFDTLNEILGYVVTSVVAADMVWSLFSHSRDPRTQTASAGYVAIRRSLMDYKRIGVCLLVLAA